MAKPNPLVQQATVYANAAVPTIASINQQYGQASGDTQGFTKALVGLLQGQMGADPYGKAVDSQSAANNAAVARLQALGMGGAGAAAAVGGMGDSSLGALNASRGATSAYLSKMPGVAAATGQAGLRAIQTAKETALDQRNQTFRSALVQAEQQLQQLGLQRAQLKQSANQFAATQKYQYAALNARNSQFTASQKQQYQEFLLSQAQQLKLAQANGTGQYTPSEVQSFTKTANGLADLFVGHGMPVQDAINSLIRGHNIPPQIAQNVILNAYATQTPPVKAQFAKRITGASGNPATVYPGYAQAVAAYKAGILSLDRYMAASRIANTKEHRPPGGPGRSNAKGNGTPSQTPAQKAQAMANAQAKKNQPDLSFWNQ